MTQTVKGWIGSGLRRTAAMIFRRWLAPLVEAQIENRLRIGNTVFGGPESRLCIAPTAGVIGVFCNVSSGKIVVEDYASVSNGAMLVTGSHDIGVFDRARQEAYPREGRDIIVRRGAWICSGAIVLGPCVVGENAVVAAGAVVHRDVPSHTVVAGVPARVVKTIAPR
jgi:acetyltransferase-like isoleucine patch superfamily enzyme